MDEQNHRSMDRRSLLARGGAVAAGAVGLTVAGVATAAPALAAGLGYTPITPYRAFDSRPGGPAQKLANNEAENVQLITDLKGDPTVVPATAEAVTYNLTISQTEGSGFLGVVPPGTALNPLPVSNINWVVPNLDLANSGTAKVGTAEGKPGSVLVFCGGSGRTHYIVDVTGYFAP